MVQVCRLENIEHKNMKQVPFSGKYSFSASRAATKSNFLKMYGNIEEPEWVCWVYIDTFHYIFEKVRNPRLGTNGAKFSHAIAYRLNGWSYFSPSPSIPSNEWNPAYACIAGTQTQIFSPDWVDISKLLNHIYLRVRVRCLLNGLQSAIRCVWFIIAGRRGCIAHLNITPLENSKYIKPSQNIQKFSNCVKIFKRFETVSKSDCENELLLNGNWRPTCRDYC